MATLGEGALHLLVHCEDLGDLLLLVLVVGHQDVVLAEHLGN